MSQKPRKSAKTAQPKAAALRTGSLAAAVRDQFHFASDDDQMREGQEALLRLLAEAERRAVPLLLAGGSLMSFNTHGEIDDAIQKLAVDVLPDAAREAEELSDLVSEGDGDDRLFDLVYGHQVDLMRAAFCLGLAMGTRLGGVRCA